MAGGDAGLNLIVEDNVGVSEVKAEVLADGEVVTSNQNFWSGNQPLLEVPLDLDIDLSLVGKTIQIVVEVADFAGNTTRRSVEMDVLPSWSISDLRSERPLPGDITHLSYSSGHWFGSFEIKRNTANADSYVFVADNTEADLNASMCFLCKV